MTKLTQEHEAYMETYTGIRFDFLEPKLEQIEIVDIMHHLSQLCRYSGATLKFYSVAEHSCHIYDAIKRDYPSLPAKELATALLHDAGETYYGDIIRPIKHNIPGWKPMTEKVDRTIAERFELVYPLPDIVHEYDNRILVDERTQAMSDRSTNIWFEDNLQPINVKLKFWTPVIAYQEFYYRLSFLGMLE